jgi:alkyl hydroperoxide reductase subunit AhpC
MVEPVQLGTHRCSNEFSGNLKLMFVKLVILMFVSVDYTYVCETC